MAGLGLGAMAGSFAHTTQSSTLGGTTITSSTPKGLAIGSVVGLAAGGVVALVLLTHSRQFYVEIGSPMELNLSQPLTLAENQVVDAMRQAQSQPPDVMPIAPRPLPSFPTDHGICHTRHSRHASDYHSGYTRHRRFTRQTGHGHPQHAIDSGNAVSLPVAASEPSILGGSHRRGIL
jgi:hypothetical protein